MARLPWQCEYLELDRRGSRGCGPPAHTSQKGVGSAPGGGKVLGTVTTAPVAVAPGSSAGWGLWGSCESWRVEPPVGPLPTWPQGGPWWLGELGTAPISVSPAQLSGEPGTCCHAVLGPQGSSRGPSFGWVGNESVAEPLPPSSSQ